ncbi:ABC transporter substrate-binding protein [Geothermobacter hydrogeniphilus]|uniref:ABC transporter substrate-binding protein n=1 Tax=Geothermobacter hydrogeniphilus TaxID=1969733 RepID=A0A1X0XLF5_9BACT|nr:ABC transporter substrate-binding protein [Geothermobacter hydrogeniphilus]ORJ53683.1 ABC transporter substrate-binding protein [Geothermobacter hydrogeniphilus]
MGKRFLFIIVTISVVFLSGIWAHAASTAKIGFTYIMSGPFSAYGQFAKQGAEMAIAEINAAGGINGMKVEGFFEDSTGKADVALRAIRKLVYQDKVDMLIGLDSSGVAKTVVPAIEKMKTPLIITHAATPDVTGSVCNKYTFRISLNLAQNVKAAALLAKETGAKKWTTVGPDYAFGHQSWEYFEKYLKELNPEATFLPKNKVAFPPFKTTDFSSYITKVMSSKPDGVFISLWGGNLIDFVRQASDMGFFNGDFQVLMSLGGAIEVLTALGDKMPEGLWVGSRYWFQANDSAINKKFVASYLKKYGAYPSYNAHGAYSAVYAYKAAAEKAKSLDKEGIAKALEGLKIEIPTGLVEIRKGDHQAITDAHWGKTSAAAGFSHRILKPIKIFKGADITPSIAETGCSM